MVGYGGFYIGSGVVLVDLGFVGVVYIFVEIDSFVVLDDGVGWIVWCIEVC